MDAATYVAKTKGKHMRQYIAFIMLLLTACTQGSSETPPIASDLATLLERHAEARGGKDAVGAVQAVSVTLEITEPTFTVSGYYRASRAGQMRIDIYDAGQRVFTEALGPDGGWQMVADETVADLSPDGASALQRGVVSNLYGLHELPSLGYKLDLVGSTERNNSTFWEIEITAPDGFSEHVFLDKDTFLIASKVETSALHPDLDPEKTPQETFFTDYQESGGVLFSRKSETRNLETGDVMQTAIVKSHDVNVAFGKKEFRRPADAF